MIDFLKDINFGDWATLINLISICVPLVFRFFSRELLYREGVGEEIISRIEELIALVKSEAAAVRKRSSGPF